MEDGECHEHTPLVRVLGVREVASASFNGIVGVGIFGLPALVAGVLGPAAIIAYAVWSLFQPLGVRAAIHVLMTAGIAVALLRFGMLERRALKYA